MDWYALGRSIGTMERGSYLAAVEASGNVALMEQLGKLTHELETFQRMASQHAIDSGVGRALSTREAIENGRANGLTP